MIDKKILEGIIDADTSAATPNPDEEENEEVSLNNATVPTPEEEANANIGLEENPEAFKEESNSSLVGDTTTDAEPEPELGEELMDQEIDPTNESVESEPEVTGEPIAPDNVVDPEGVSEAPATKTFTQSQVDEIAGKVRKETREKTIRDIYSRYGVNTADELDNLMADAQRFATSKDEFTEKENAWKQADEARNQELLSVKERVALLESGIDRNRFEDARLILRGKGLDVTAENIEAELATHPEWRKQEPTPVEQAGLPFVKTGEPAAAPMSDAAPTKISIPTLGNNSADNPQPELSERERAMKMFKV